MGNKTSKIKSPYEILEVSPLHSLRDIKLSYLRLMKKNSFSEYNTAYSLIKTSPPPLELYTDNLIKYRDDIIEKINMFGKCNIPLLSSNEYKISYRMLSRLNIKYQWRNETDRKYFYYHLDRIVNYLRKNDDRFNNIKDKNGMNNGIVDKKDNNGINTNIVDNNGINNNIVDNNNDNIKDNNGINYIKDNIENKKDKSPIYNCTECNKSFKSTNTLLDHYKSKKHLSNIKDENPFEYLKNQINKISIKENEKLKIEIKDEKIEKEIKNETIKKDKEIKKSSYKLDHVVFRTCSKCKEVFDTRVLLLYHIREIHK